MGVPVVSLAGERHASRMGLSILSAAGFASWCASSPEAFCDIAAALATNTDLGALRAGMRERLRRSPLMDAIQFTAALESALVSLAAA